MERTERVERTEAILAPPLMTVAEAARVARVSQSYIRKLIARGTIGAVRVGDGEAGPLRIPTESFERWLFGGLPRTCRRLGVGGR
jgi:excisionase family DNA binding protein